MSVSAAAYADRRRRCRIMEVIVVILRMVRGARGLLYELQDQGSLAAWKSRTSLVNRGVLRVKVEDIWRYTIDRPAKIVGISCV